MNRVDVHRAWARPDGRWSAWVKPLLFASLASPASPASLDEGRAPEPLGPPPAWLFSGVLDPLAAAAGGGASYRSAHDPLADTALVIDLPGAEGTLAGIALAAHGFAPVPLYNALWDEAAVVDTGPLRDALVDGAAALPALPDTAPPAFLLDANRHGRGRPIRTGDFDNRSFCAPADFPSADTLRDAGVRRAVLIQRGDAWPAADLAPTLLDWQRRGLALFLARLDEGGSFAPLRATRPPWPVRLGHRLGRLFFKRRADGGFGELVPLPVHSAS